MTTIEPMQAPNALLVEDSPIIQKVQRWLLEELGFKVDVADSGNAALALFEKMRAEGNRYEMALVDFELPDTYGTEIVKVLKKHHPNTVVVIATACVSDFVKSACEEAGSDFVLTKPITVDVLKTHLQALIPS